MSEDIVFWVCEKETDMGPMYHTGTPAMPYSLNINWAKKFSSKEEVETEIQDKGLEGAPAEHIIVGKPKRKLIPFEDYKKLQ